MVIEAESAIVCRRLPAGARAFAFLVLAAVWLGVPTGWAAETNAAVSLDEVTRALGQAESVFSRFTQERHLSLFAEPLRSEGYLLFQQPGLIRWEVTQPYKSILVSDGSGVAQFEWVDQQWKKLDIGLAGAMQNIVGQIAGIMKGEYARSQREYQTSLSNSPSGPVLTLVPRNEKMRKMMRAIEVHLAPDLKATRQVILRESEGDFTAIRFDDQAVNFKFPERTFDRKAPLDIESIRPAGRGDR